MFPLSELYPQMGQMLHSSFGGGSLLFGIFASLEAHSLNKETHNLTGAQERAD